jgi:hypothetical protein
MSKSLVEVKHAVFEFFQQESCLCPASQTELVKFECENPDLKMGLVEEALRDLEKYEITRGFTSPKGDKYWVLTKPLSVFERQITFGYDTLTCVADVLNSYAALQNSEKTIVDASTVTERDIARLGLIAQALLPPPQKSS